MKHLNEINLSYWEHMRLALINSVKLLVASIVLTIHAVIPCIFTSTSSKIIKNILNSMPKKSGERILIRFNTKWKEDRNHRQWRVLIEGKERLVHEVIIGVPCMTLEEEINGEQKFHFLCFGFVRFVNCDIDWTETAFIGEEKWQVE